MDMSRDELVRRFIDDELSVDERQQLLATAAADLALSTALLQAQELRAELSRVRDLVPETRSDHVQRIMQRAVKARASRDASPWRWMRELWRPRLRVSAGGLLLSALIVALVMWSSVFLPRQSPQVFAAAQRSETVNASVGVPLEPDEHEMPVPVRLVLPAKGAKSVSVVGDFNAWRPDAMFLDDADGDGVFVTTLALPPGSYDYMFVIDGERWLTDPLATNVRDDGFGQRNAVLRVN
jgi:hypothetical protein